MARKPRVGPPMLPTVPDDATLELWVSRIIAQWRAATPDQMARGRTWYPTARQVATLMAEGNTRAGAGVIAALSPQKSWEANVELARGAFVTGEAAGQVGDACAKAQRIMLGEDPLMVLPEDSKTWNFFRNIIDPTDADAVTVDRHAHDIVAGEPFGSANRRYRRVLASLRVYRACLPGGSASTR